jgi:hypothetical protein
VDSEESNMTSENINKEDKTLEQSFKLMLFLAIVMITYSSAGVEHIVETYSTDVTAFPLILLRGKM